MARRKVKNGEKSPWVSEEALSQAQPVKKHTKVFQKRSGARISGIQLSGRLQSLLNL